MTNDMHRTIRWGIAAATIALLPLTTHLADDAPVTPACDSDYSCMGDASLHDSDADRIPEDDPRWDCATMGNQICGSFWYDGGAEDSGIEVYSDGAGVQYDGGDEVRTFPADTFADPTDDAH